MKHPFAELIALASHPQPQPGRSVMTLAVDGDHLNPHHVVHGAVMYARADTGMGAALYPTLAPGEICATIEIKMNYFKAVSAGTLRCETEIMNRGKTVANLQSRILLDDVLVALANGNYAIFTPRSPPVANVIGR